MTISLPKFRFSLKITIIGSILILCMLRLSYWQWQRHLSKIEYIKILQQRIEMPISNINELLNKNTDYSSIPYRRMYIEGEYDFSHEMLLRNRRLDGNPGVFVITPLKLKDRNDYLLVSRGFIPIAYSTKEKRKIFEKNAPGIITVLAKPPQTQRFLAPEDPETGGDNPWVDAWLRVDIEKISKQLPYSILPIYAEVMSTDNLADTTAKIITSKSERDDIFFMAGKGTGSSAAKEINLDNYPIPVYDTVIPPGRHLGYVFEWAIMALMTFLICLVLQFKRPAEENSRK
jgi:surfeit locus 1 family protein